MPDARLLRCASMSLPHRPSLEQSLAGCLLGTAVGDSIGLPYENLSRRSVEKLARGPLSQSLLFGRRPLSGDTEHTQMVGLSLLEAAIFRRRLAGRLWSSSSA
jgi:ADP-ribosyl-[dinitrogen reductase] hydrolase